MKDPGLLLLRRGRRNMDRQFDIVITFPLFVNGIKVFLDIFIRDDPLQSLSQNLLSADLKILLCDGIKDLNSPLGVGKDDRLLKISQDNLIEILLCSIHPERIHSIHPYRFRA